MILLPNGRGKEEITPCGLKDRPSNSINKVGYGASSCELMAYQQEKYMTHVEAPSSTTVLKMIFMLYTTCI
jgi:hypothetical protein